MAKEDYKVDVDTGQVRFKGDLVATFNKENGAIASYDGDGMSRKRWIAEAVKEALDDAAGVRPITEEEVDNVRFGRLDIYQVFPKAPKPRDNKLGFDHPDIYDWVSDNYKQFVPILYPYGKWNAFQAGQGVNKTHNKAGKETALDVQG